MAEEPSALREVLALLTTGDGEQEPLRAFACAMLRRAPDELYRDLPAEVIAARVRHAFGAADGLAGNGPVIRIHRERSGGTFLEVVSEDRRFLLSTLKAELEVRDIPIRWSLHPIIGVTRDTQGCIRKVGPARQATHRVSIVHLELGHLAEDRDDALVVRLRDLVRRLRLVSDDHHPMHQRLELTATELRARAAERADPTDAVEVAALLDWLLDDNLVLLGIGEYEAADGTLTRVPERSLGLVRDEDPVLAGALPWPPADDERVPGSPELLTVTRTRDRSPIQRRARIEVLALNRYGADGTPRGQSRIYGLLTRKAVAEPVRGVPVLRRRLAEVLDLEDVVDGSHDAIALGGLLQALPKDELLRTPSDRLHGTLLALLAAEMRGEPVACIRLDAHTATAAVVFSVPGERWDADLRQRFVADLRSRFGTDEVDVDVTLQPHAHAIGRILLHDVRAPFDDPSGSRGTEAVTTVLQRLARSWHEAAGSALSMRLPEATAAHLRRSLLHRMPLSYRDRTSPADAPADLLLLDAVAVGSEPLLVAFRSSGSDDHGERVRLLAAKRDVPLELSAFLPIVESLGLTVVEELPHELHGDTPRLTLHDFGVRAAGLDVDADGPRLADAIQAAWRGHLEVDPMNRLVLEAAVDWRDVSILRAYRRLRRQLGTAYTPAYVDSALAAHPDVVRNLVDYVHARFDPRRNATDADRAWSRGQVVDGLDALTRLDHDRILRGILELIDATLRTNAFRSDAVADDTGEPYIAFKFDPSRIVGVPAPVPYREIFVHSPRVEGVHLRAGSVARGGLRWSDRRDDVRTEVLDLLKAQVLKNAVIVPTGAKGGFVVTHEPADPAELREEVRRQYVTFIRGLLDVTDDLDGDELVPPPEVVRHDGDDPYLVVAADRGTATFSDTANAVAGRYGFWLDDAFASGGSQGYDHKVLGVTARGAWVAVTRHFRELGLDVASDPITVAGVGDMSGDVFGNGLLRSRAVRLVAAFDHRHIFIDPDPDPDRSFDERSRLFDLPRSSWDDYDREILGPDGIIVPRGAKRIVLNDRIRGALRIDAETLSPPELIQAILRAPVDLLFAGGIGTYVKASTERHADLGDRANDDLRVDASELRARVLGEGANLFITQRGRIELARRGGQVNQDAVDNAAGVATSDLEVNIKILLRLAMDDGLIDGPRRDEVLADLADDVVAAALRTVDRQAAAISREAARCPGLLHAYVPMLERLERDADLDRHVDVLPDDAELHRRMEAGAGLTRPELATMVAWAKRQLKELLLDSAVPDSSLCRVQLDRAFPERLIEQFPDLAHRHRLRRELIATHLANEVVDRMGVTFVDHLADETGASMPEVVRAFQAARVAVDAERWWGQLDALEQVHDPRRVREFEAPLEELLTTLTRALLTDRAGGAPEERVGILTEVAHRMLDAAAGLGTEDQRRARQARARRLVDDLVEDDLAQLLASARDLTLLPDVATVHAAVADQDLAEVADTLLQLGQALGIERLEHGLRGVSPTDVWTRRQRLGLTADLRRARCRAAIDAHHGADGRPAVDTYLTDRRAGIDRSVAVVKAAERADEPRLDALAVGVRAVVEVVQLGHVAT